MRSRCRIKLGQYAEAEADRAAAVSARIGAVRNDNQFNALKADLWTAFTAGDYDIVLALAPAMLDRWSDSPELHFLIAQSLHNQGADLSRSLEHYSHALDHGFDEFWGRMGRGRVLRDLGRLTEARRDFKRALSIRPDDGGAREILASIERAA
jgi:tetratricopeptide (TPR) repeat protein